MPYELRITSTSDWRPVTKTEANRRAVCHYLRERLSALFGLVDRGMILDCNGHGQIRRKPGRWNKKQERLFSSIKKGNLVTIQTINGDRQTLRAIRQVGECWKLTEGEAFVWNVVEVKGAQGGTKSKRKKTRKKTARKKRAVAPSGLDALEPLDTL